MYYQVPLEISKQEDGLWRVDAPSLQGCWVDAPTLQEGLSEIQIVIAMFLDTYKEDGRPLPKEVSVLDQLPLKAELPVFIEEHKFRRVAKAPSKRKASQ